MRKRGSSLEFLFQLGALLVAFTVVHGIYVAEIRPRAQAILAADAERQRAEPTYVPQRSWYVIVVDYEQEGIFVLSLWALAIMGWKLRESLAERRLLATDLLPLVEGSRVLPEDAREYARHLEALPASTRQLLLPRALLAALDRFGTTGAIQDAAAAAEARCESESARLDSELAVLRYIAWAIPSLGFIGTVRGIGEALALAQRAVEGDISGVTRSLGTAFNSTLVALLVSILLMFLLHWLQREQERLVLDTSSWVEHRLLRHLRTP